MAKKKRTKRKAPIKLNIFKVWYLVAAVITLFVAVMFLPKQQQEFCANSISCINNLTGKYETTGKTAVFHGQSVAVPSSFAKASPEDEQTPVLGETTSSNKHIYIDLSTQTLYAYEGNKLIYSFLVSTGKWGRTPTGDFTVWIKLRYTRMSGGDQSLGTYYNLPNVPYVMFFSNNEIPKTAGYSIHGAYWHNNFGHPMSHGCVNMKPEEAEKVYYWANPPTQGNLTYATKDSPGTPITIYGDAPAE
ncbi:MAG: L,D-transpeptidase [bacterium]|nr:L,D-transpeptidase [bacterium]